jgi:membrane protease subunit HflK
VVARAEGEARRFSLIAREYANAPAVTRERLYIETMEEMLSNTTKIYIDQRSGNNLLYLPIDRLAPRADVPAPVGPAPPAADSGAASPLRDGSRGRADLRRRAP